MERDHVRLPVASQIHCPLQRTDCSLHLVNILQTSFGLVSAVAGKYTLDIVTGYDRSRLWQVVIILVSTAAVSLALNNLSGRIALKTRIAVTNRMEEDAFAAVMDTDWLSFNRYQSGDILNRFKGDIPTSAQYAINWLPDLIGSAYGFAAALGVILHYDAFMALIALASAPFTFLISRKAIYRMREYSLRQKKISSVLFSFENEAFHNYDTLKALSLGQDYTEKLKTIQQDSYKPGEQFILYQDRHLCIRYSICLLLHLFRLLPLPALDRRHHIRDDDSVYAATG